MEESAGILRIELGRLGMVVLFPLSDLATDEHDNLETPGLNEALLYFAKDDLLQEDSLFMRATLLVSLQTPLNFVPEIKEGKREAPLELGLDLIEAKLRLA